MCQVQWGQVLAGVLIGIIIGWLPMGVKMILKAIRRCLDRRLARRIEQDVMDDPKIPEEDKEDIIAKRKQAIRDARDPFGPQTNSGKRDGSGFFPTGGT